MSVSDQPTNEVISEVTPEVEVKNEISVQDLQKQLDDLKSTNARLLDENYKTKNKFKEVRDKWEEMEAVRKEKLTAEERVKEMENELLRKQQLLEDREAHLIESNMMGTIKSIADDIISPRQVRSLMGDKQYRDLIEIDSDGLNITKDSAQKIINSLRENEPNLFRAKSIPSMETGGPKREVPNMSVNEKLASSASIKEGVKNLSTDELREYLKANYKVS